MRRIVFPSVVAAYLLDSTLLAALQSHFSFMATWDPPELGDCFFALWKEEHVHSYFTLESPQSTRQGVYAVYTSNGTAAWADLELSPGEQDPAVVIPSGTKYVLFKYKVPNYLGEMNTTYFMSGTETVVYPLSEPDPDVAAEVSAMIAKECGITVA